MSREREIAERITAALDANGWIGSAEHRRAAFDVVREAIAEPDCVFCANADTGGGPCHKHDMPAPDSIEAMARECAGELACESTCAGEAEIILRYLRLADTKAREDIRSHLER